MPMELVDAQMVALGSRFKSLSRKEVQATRDMYTIVQSAGIIANAIEDVPNAPSAPAKHEKCSSAL
jgi:hypothetical protein